MFDEAHRLHRKDEPRFPPGHLYSMLDMLGAEITCDFCGRWQRLPTLMEYDADALAQERGWTKCEGKDVCPICKAQSNGVSLMAPIP